MFLLCFQNALPWRKSWEKLVYRLILFFSTTEIFSKRRKIYSRIKENQSYANVGFVIEKMYDKQAAFLLWFLANSMSMRVSNALFIMVILSRNFWLGIMNGSRLQDLQWIFVNPLEFGWFSLTFIRTRIDYSLHYFDYYRLRTLCPVLACWSSGIWFLLWVREVMGSIPVQARHCYLISEAYFLLGNAISFAFWLRHVEVARSNKNESCWNRKKTLTEVSFNTSLKP